MKVHNWGRYPVVEASLKSFTSSGDAIQQMLDTDSGIARGLGRCYGDSALSTNILSALQYNCMLDFDEDSGVLTCQSGVSFEDILKVFVPKGWFLPVTPGTKFITVGGAIASDIHGKNHHKDGGFSNHVLWFTLLTAKGEILKCSKKENTEVFEASCGGMGLTGIVLDVAFKLKKIESAFIRQESSKAKNLDELLELIDASQDWTYTVAWLDTISGGKKSGRGVLLKGEHATLEDLKGKRFAKSPLRIKEGGSLNVPFTLPSWVLNPLTTRLLNMFYYGKFPKGNHSSIMSYDPYFYPLDAIHNWNRGYGKRGFTQYQLVVPMEGSRAALKKILAYVRSKGMGSFLTVLKLFDEAENMISFPMKGYTLTMDFPISKKLFPFLDDLDKIVLEYGGRLYLAKDVRMKAEMFKASYPNWEKFMEIRKRLDPNGRFASLQSKRIGL